MDDFYGNFKPVTGAHQLGFQSFPQINHKQKSKLWVLLYFPTRISRALSGSGSPLEPNFKNSFLRAPPSVFHKFSSYGLAQTENRFRGTWAWLIKNRRETTLKLVKPIFDGRHRRRRVSVHSIQALFDFFFLHFSKIRGHVRFHT